MDKSNNKGKLFMMICICILVLSIVGSTLAYYRLVLFDDLTVDTITHGLDYYINYTGGTNIDSATLQLVDSYTEATSSSTEVSFYKNDNTYDIYGHIYLDINSIGENTRNSDSLKYTVVNSTTGVVLSSGKLKDRIEGNRALIKSNIPLKTTEELFKIYIWLDINENVDTNMEGENLSLTVKAEATMKQINDPVNAVDYISNLYKYSSKSVVENNEIDYNYATSVSLMNDRLGGTTSDYDEGNIRYYGTNPNNYIDIGDRDSEGNLILWRIIGTFENIQLSNGMTDRLIKVVRDESMGKYSWDQSLKDINEGKGINEWSQADLMKLLNPGHENEEVGGSLYWNRASGSCYGYDDIIKEYEAVPCDFKNSGLSEELKNKIETVKWNMGGYDDSDIYVNDIYKYERLENVFLPGITCQGEDRCNDSVVRTTTWLGKIALAYPSDYGYAVDLKNCVEMLRNYNNCVENNWMYSTLTANGIYSSWLLTPRSLNSRSAWRVSFDGFAYHDNYVLNVLGMSPVFYLKSSQNIIYGDGSEDNPYVLG